MEHRAPQERAFLGPGTHTCLVDHRPVKPGAHGVTWGSCPSILVPPSLIFITVHETLCLLSFPWTMWLVMITSILFIHVSLENT